MFSQHRARLVIVLAATGAVTALGSVGVLASSGRAQSATSERTLHFVATTYGGFESSRTFRDGTVFGFKDRVRADDGTTGRAVAACTATDVRHKESLCHIAVIFPNGQLVLEFLHHESSKPAALALIGGTGAYAGARGSAIAKDVSETRTDITVNFAD